MDKTSYSNHAKGWEFAEESPLNSESEHLRSFRRQAEAAGFHQCSLAQGAFLQFLAGETIGASIILLGTGSAIEALRLIQGLHGQGQFTAVDSSAEGANLIRKTFQTENTPGLRLRAVNAPAGTYFTRLNPADYDLIVVSGEAGNYRDALNHAPRLLKEWGQLVFTDAFDLDKQPDLGGLMNPANRSDKTVTIRSIIDALTQEEGLESCLLPVGTGLLLVTKAR